LTDISFSAPEAPQCIPGVICRAARTGPNRAIEELLGALDGWAQSYPELIYVAASGTRLERGESIQRRSALFHLESSDRTAEMVHQEAANEIIPIPETLCDYIVGRKE
jgi:hypothetical protein